MTREPLLAREAELASITERLGAARAGDGGVVVLEGPAGIGKTRLLEVTLERAGEEDMTVLPARAGEFDRQFPFSVVRQLFEPLVRGLDADEQAEVLAGAAAHAAPALGLAPARTGGGDGEDLSGPVVHGIYWLTANLAARRPLLLAVDDAQWADTASLRWLAFLVSRVADLPLVLLLAIRRLEAAPDAHLLLSILDDRTTSVIHPAPLGDDAIASLLCEALGEDPEPPFSEACRTATGGNPFLLHELCRALTTQAVRPLAASADQVHEVTPDAVARSVDRRLREAGEAATDLARSVAILGGVASWRDAVALAGLDSTAASAAVDRLAAADVLRANGQLRFTHPMVSGAVYHGIPSGERATGHTRAARLLAEEGHELDRMAGQLLATHPAGEDWVVDALRSAARFALERGAPEAAAEYLRRALAENPSGEVRATVLAELGAAETRAGWQGGSQHLREALGLADEPVLKGRTALELGLALVARGRLAEAVEVFDAAILEIEEHDPQLAFRLEADLLGAARLEIFSRSLVEERLRRVRQGSPSQGASPLLLGVEAFHAALTGEAAERVTTLGEAALAGDLSPYVPLADSPPLNEAAFALVIADRFDPAERFYANALADARRRGSAVGFATASCWRAFLAFRRGSVAEAEAEARSGLDAAEDYGWALGQPATLACLLDALLERGDLAGAEAAIQQAGPPQLSGSAVVNALLYSRGRLRLAQARPREALDDFLLCGARQDAWGAPNPALFPWRSSAALAQLALEQEERARELVEEEVKLARAFGAPRALGLATRTQGVVIGGREGLTLLESAVEVLDTSAARLEHAHALVDLGAAQRRGGRRVIAREPLRVGLDLARACGADALATRAHTELLAAGGRPRRLELSGPASLTPSERRVADMAADGLTNREIAQALFVTQKTIEVHLGNAYRKLDINVRAELPEALRRH